MLIFLISTNKKLRRKFYFRLGRPLALVLSNRDGFLLYQSSGSGGPMYSTKTSPLNDEYFERDIDGANLEAEGTSSNKVH
jgi:hypothetical protein